MEVFECPACGNALGPRAVLIAASERLAVFFNGKTVCTGALDRAGKADWRRVFSSAAVDWVAAWIVAFRPVAWIASVDRVD
jgi:hypothetical protein